MARVTSINRDGELTVCGTVKFERNSEWTKIIGYVPSTVKGIVGDEGIDPESEYILQRLIELHPEILPWDEFADGSTADDVRVCVVCSEITSSLTDILLIEQTPTGAGRFVIVETKLVKNPQIYRDVLGQVLEYAAYFSSSETSQSLENKAKAYWRDRRREAATDFEREMKRVFGDDRSTAIWNSAFENARKRNIRLLIVSDSLPEQLRLAVTYLPSSVLLSAVEFQAHSERGNEHPTVFTGATSATVTEATVDQFALREYFSNVTLSHTTCNWSHRVQSFRRSMIVVKPQSQTRCDRTRIILRG